MSNTTYYLINRKHRKEFSELLHQCEKLFKRNYYAILKYCRDKDGDIVNLQYGEKFITLYMNALDKIQKDSEKIYKFKVGVVETEGFFMSDLSEIGIYSISQLINFLRSNKNFIVEDQRGRRVTIMDLKQTVLIKGEHLHHKEAVNSDRMKRIRRATDILNEVLSEEKGELDGLEEAMVQSTYYNDVRVFCEKLNNVVEKLEEIQ